MILADMRIFDFPLLPRSQEQIPIGHGHLNTSLNIDE